jgi:hypothetical protein
MIRLLSLGSLASGLLLSGWLVVAGVPGTAAAQTIEPPPPPPPQAMLELAIASVPARFEGNSGVTLFGFTVGLFDANGNSALAPVGGVTFNISTEDGTAKAGEDYTALLQALGSIAEGQSSYAFDVQVLGDTLVEPDELFNVRLSNPVNALISQAGGFGPALIRNDDAATPVPEPGVLALLAAALVPAFWARRLAQRRRS